MKFVISPDSMKGSLPAGESSRLMAEVCRRLFPGCETVLLPAATGARARWTPCGRPGEIRRGKRNARFAA